MLSIISKCHYAEYCYARCILLSIIMLIVVDKLSVIEMIVDVPNLSVRVKVSFSILLSIC